MVKNNETAIKGLSLYLKMGVYFHHVEDFEIYCTDRYQNIETQIVLPEMEEVLLKDLLPERWDGKWN